MEHRKLIVKIAYGLIAVLVLVLIAMNIYQQRFIRQMGDAQDTTPSAEVESSADTGTQNQKAQNKSATNAIAAGDVHGTPAGELDTLQYQLESAEEELNMAREDLSNEIEKQAEATRNQLELTKKMLQNPATKEMIRTNMKSTLNLQYGDLFTKLNLSEEKLDAFKELLTEQQMQTLDISMDAIDQSLSEEQQQEIAARLESLNTDFDSQVSDLLGSNNFEAYDTYRERVQERQYATTFTQSLSTDDGVTETQKQDLIDAMYTARKEIDAKYDINSENTEIDVEKQIERLNLTFERYAASADGILTDSQTEKFKDQLNQQKEMLVMTIKMAGQLYGASTTD